ncbi:MAG: YitT family protein [Bacteroidales bacterium]|nr:YitT family protein [Bacteroidales bacterium]
MKKTSNILIEIKNYAVITVCLFIIALGWTAFLIPNNMLGGGVNGIATIVYWVTGLSTGYTIFTLNAILIIFSIKILGWRFGVKTIYCIAVMAFFFSLLQNIIGDVPVISDKFLAAIIGGGIGGFANGIIFLAGGSTGGVDIITMVVNKYRNISLGRFTLAMNLVIIGSSFFVFQDLEILERVELIIYSLVGNFVSSYCMDLAFTGSKQSVQMFIFSSKPEVIANRIGNEIHRGVTVIRGTGWYTKQDSDILMAVVRKTECQPVIRIVKQEDPKAFVSVNTVMGVYGKGFEAMKK